MRDLLCRRCNLAAVVEARGVRAAAGRLGHRPAVSTGGGTKHSTGPSGGCGGIGPAADGQGKDESPRSLAST